MTDTPEIEAIGRSNMTVKVHPLGEIIAKKLFSIETVPMKEQTKMVHRACKAAMEYHDQAMKELREKTILECANIALQHECDEDCYYGQECQTAIESKIRALKERNEA